MQSGGEGGVILCFEIPPLLVNGLLILRLSPSLVCRTIYYYNLWILDSFMGSQQANQQLVRAIYCCRQECQKTSLLGGRLASLGAELQLGMVAGKHDIHFPSRNQQRIILKRKNIFRYNNFKSFLYFSFDLFAWFCCKPKQLQCNNL